MRLTHVQRDEGKSVAKVSMQSLEFRDSAHRHGAGDGSERDQKRSPVDKVPLADVIPVGRREVEVRQLLAGVRPTVERHILDQYLQIEVWIKVFHSSSLISKGISVVPSRCAPIDCSYATTDANAARLPLRPTRMTTTRRPGSLLCHTPEGQTGVDAAKAKRVRYRVLDIHP
jgi:hypothetical protein